ncbi:MAG: hypothetical protein KAT27_07955 [Desulfobacterales bacterium]|nr:hypothetical protein [Desulfobacterales bacterium]
MQEIAQAVQFNWSFYGGSAPQKLLFRPQKLLFRLLLVLNTAGGNTVLSIPVYAILIWSFFQPSIASYVFIIFLACFEGWLLVAYFFGKPELVSSSKDWSAAELSEDWRRC